MMLMYLFFS